MGYRRKHLSSDWTLGCEQCDAERVPDWGKWTLGRISPLICDHLPVITLFAAVLLLSALRSVILSNTNTVRNRMIWRTRTAGCRLNYRMRTECNISIDYRVILVKYEQNDTERCRMSYTSGTRTGRCTVKGELYKQITNGAIEWVILAEHKQDDVK